MKKSNFNLRLPLVVFSVWLCSSLSAQTTVNMAINGATTGSPFAIAPPNSCSFNFFDSGGPSGNYNTNADAWVTFAPSNSTSHRVQVSFISFGLEEGWDALYIFNSNTLGTNQVPGPQGATNSGFPAGNWQSISPGVVRANTGAAAVGSNPEEALTVQFRSDATNTAAGWAAMVVQVPKVTCVMTAPPNVTINSGPAATSCFVNVNTPLPTFSPGGCNTGFQLQYRMNGGAPVIVTDIGSTTLAAPTGQNVLVWELIDACGNAILASGVQVITVIDNTAPVLTCLSNVTLTLAPGDCTAEYDYNLSLYDNCSFLHTSSVSHPIDFDNGQAGVMFNVTNLGFNPITLTEFGPSLDMGTWPMEVYYTTTASTWSGNQNNPAAWTLAGSATVTSLSPGSGTPIGGFSITLASGQTKGIYITSKSGTPVNFTGTGAGVSRQFDDGILRVASNPGGGIAYPFGVTNQSRAYNGYVKYQVAAPGVPIQTAGLPSGSKFPLGTTTNVFTAVDASGNTTACSFKVTVKPFPNPVWSLVCNDLIFVALGDDCMSILTADQVLEGGPYKCYDEYVVELDKVPPYGNGPWVPAVLTSADIGKSYGVKVTDPQTGNKCQGDIKVMDNLAPKLDCALAPLFLPCSFSTEPGFSKKVAVEQRFGATGLPINVVDNQTRTFEIPVSAPGDAKINDVDCRVKISGDAFAFNLRIEIESPTGTKVKVWDEFGGCPNQTLLARFDDEGLGGVPQCPDLTSDKRIAPPFAIGQLSAFDNKNPNGTWKIHISDVDPGGNISKIELAELYINMTGTYTAGFPNGVTAPPATKIGSNTYSVPAGLIDACSDVTLTFVDQTTNEACTSGFTATINRRWTAKDASGNTSSCLQQLKLLRPSLSDVIPPPNYDGVDEPAFLCTKGMYPTPQWIEGQGLQGQPNVYGMNTGCAISWTYDDQVAKVCDGTYNVTRRWTVVDFCGSQSTVLIQLIQVQDKAGPTFTCPANVTASTDPFSCCATVNLPDLILDDECSRVTGIQAEIYVIDPYTLDTTTTYVIQGSLTSFPGNNTTSRDTLGVLPSTACLPFGDHLVRYVATDQCNNTSYCTFTLSVRDFSPPVVSCDETTVVAMGTDDPSDCYFPSANGCEFAGVTWLRASTLDDGSHDNCGKLRFVARRLTPYSDCILGLNKDKNCGKFKPTKSEFDLATTEGDSIKFYCCEVGTTQSIVLRAYQLDPDGSISLYPDGTPIFNECTVKVEVQDKLKPQCDPPLNVTVNCENFDPSLWAYGQPLVYDNCCLDSTVSFQGQKGLTHSANYAQFDSLCNRGTIIRTFRVFDCHGFSGQCTQRVIVTPDQNGYAIRFPDDKVVTTCDGSPAPFGEPTFQGKDCELLGVSFEDQVFTVVPDACFKIERTWTVINWCTYNPNLACIDVPNPNPNATVNHPSNLPGPVVSKPGMAPPWTATVVKVNPNDLTATDYSKYWSGNANCYRYKQIIKVTDTQKPFIQCPVSPVNFCDQTPNNNLLWNDPYWWDPKLSIHDLCEAPVDLNVTATDACSGSNIDIRYLLFLDLDNDGTMETVVSSSNLPPANTVNYGNANSPNFGGGNPRGFDKRQVAPNELYRFAIETSTNGAMKTARVRWNTDKAPSNYVNPELPHGTHKIKWIVSDGCGNEQVCEYTFVVKDCKAPSVVCINGLSANVMPSGITLFASDFLLFAADNCSPLDNLRFGIRKSGTGTGFPFDANGNPQTSVTFTCLEIGKQPIELWVIDMAGNADFCETYVIIQDNLGNCTGNATVAGALQTEMNAGLEEAHIEVTGQNPAGPSFTQLGMTDKTGTFKFNNAIPVMSDFTMTPIKDDNPLNGVSTYDLVLISKHILGLESLKSPYKMIAADANRSGSITTFDIVELRKLILGIYTELPGNTSWRFVDKAYQFPDPTNPFKSAFPENKTVGQIQANKMGEDFVAIKIGDLNASVVANSLTGSEDRTEGTLLFDVAALPALPDGESVGAGDEFTLRFKPADQVTGYQFTLNYTDLQLLDVLPGEGMTKENFGLFLSEKALTTSWDGSQSSEFSVKFRALKTGRLSEMLSVSNRITRAEAYKPNDATSSAVTKMSVALRYNTGIVTGVGFELYQNQPNPFVQRTVIGFHLPEAATATLSIFDETGRLVLVQKGDFPKGENSIPVERGKLKGASGMLMYKLETATNSATRKMLRVH